MLLRRRSAPVALAFSILLAWSLATVLPAAATDGLTPAKVEVTLAPGESKTITKHLHLDASPGKADIMLAIDTTSSMCTAINDAKTEAASIVSQVTSDIPGARFAVADFKDYPFSIPADYPYALRSGFTADSAAIQAAINSVGTCAGGGDGPEAYNRVFFESMNDPALSYDPEAARFLVVLGDALPHDPNQQATFSSCTNSPPVDAGRDDTIGTADDLRTADMIAGLKTNGTTLLMLTYGYSSALPCYQQLTAATGGSAVAAGGGGSLATKIKQLIDTATTKIDRIELQIAPAGCELGITFDPAPPFTSLTAPLDLSFQETATAPATAGDQHCTVTAMVDGTPRAVQEWEVEVEAATTTSSTTTTTTIAPTTTDPGPLPFTGANSGPVLATGLALVALGAMVLWVARRSADRNG